MPQVQGSGRVLVVDDNVINRKHLARLLSDQGYSVTLAEDGRQAIERLNKANGDSALSLDVILLDILMPGMDGYEVLAYVKSLPHLRHVPVIMISALDEMDSVIRCVELGATDYLPKPFKPALLQARLRASLAEKRLRDLELEYLEQVGRVADAAQAVETSHFDPHTLDGVGSRDDALGRLARVFQRMAREVHLREQRLRQQLEQLRLDMEEMKRAQSEELAIYLPMDRCHALARGASLPDRTAGAALFADISGFTPLTGAFSQELGLERGAEELTRTISQVYTALIDEVHRFGGSIIGFAGDAITCWFDDGDASGQWAQPARRRAVACGLAMQAAMALCSSVTTPGGARFDLAVKVAVVAGPMRRFLVGDPQIQVLDVIAGQTLDRLAAAEHCAQRGEVVVTGDLLDDIGVSVFPPGSQSAEQLAVREWRTDARGAPIAVISGTLESVSPSPWPDLSPIGLPDAQYRPWVLPDVYERARRGHKQFLSELRPVSALFVSFSGIDYDADEAAGSKLDAYVRHVQHIAGRYEAIFDHLTMGDKGSYICLAFGAPIAHGDDETRAVRAALELLSPPPHLAFVGSVRIGVAAGQALVGTYGGKGRRTYGVQGNRVNLAARLMIAAPPGEILCDEEIYRAAEGSVCFTALPPVRVKGFGDPVPVYRPCCAPVGPPGGGNDLRAFVAGTTSPSPAAEEAVEGAAPPPAAVRNRLDLLSPSEQLTLKVASVLGRAFTVEALAQVLPVDSERPLLGERLERLTAQGLLTRGAAKATYAFAESALYDAAYASMPFVQRRMLHRRAAEWYQRAFGSDLAPHYAVLADHWRCGDEPAKAIEYLEKAAKRARAQGQLEQAERFLQDSLALDAQAAVLSASYYGDGSTRAATDFDAAIAYAVSRLERELAPELTYHSLWHSVEDVLPAVQRLAVLCGIAGDEARLLEVAAVYHDIGLAVDPRGDEHERASAEIAAQVLPGYGFSSEQVAAVQGMILATRLPQSPRTPLEEILADADLDSLGRDDGLVRSQALRTELSALRGPVGQAAWHRRQLKLFRDHRYFTSAARSLRDEGKRRNIRTLEALVRAKDPDPTG